MFVNAETLQISFRGIGYSARRIGTAGWILRQSYDLYKLAWRVQRDGASRLVLIVVGHKSLCCSSIQIILLTVPGERSTPQPDDLVRWHVVRHTGQGDEEY